MKQFITKTKIIWILIVAVAFLGCEDDDDASLPQVTASFAQTINQDTGVVSFINLSENADSYTWNFGDGTTSTEINPTKIYPTGNYTVILTAKNVAGAEGTFEDEIFINIPLPITFPINFDDTNVNYDVTTFNGAAFEIVENPDPTGANPSTSNVGQITNSGAAFEGFFFNLGEPLSLAEQKSVKVIFWSNIPIDVLLKLEEGTGGDVETTASHGGTGWEEIYFTFDSGDSFSRFTMFVDGPGTTSGTFYIDDISQVDTADIPCTETLLEIPIDFDCNGIDYATKIVGNVSFTVVENPELSGVNSEPTMVGQITNVGANWENAFFNLDTAVDFSSDKGIRMKLFSNQALPILLKFEDGTEAPVENAQNHGGTGWEELTFTLNSSASYNDMVIFVDGPGTAAGTFYVDDIEQVSVMIADPCVPETSQSLNAADFDLTFQTDPTASIGSFDAGLSWVDNPDFDNNVNKSCKVGQIDRSGAALFANNQIDFDSKFDFNANSGFRLKVWSPNAGTNVLVKLEDKANAAINIEVGAVTTVASGWEELTFDFAPGESGKYDKIILFFELNTNTTETYFIDDFRLYSSGGTGGGCTGGPNADVTSFPVDFENCEGFNISFGANQSREIIDNPVSGGINTSDKVYRFTKLAGADGFGGFQNIFAAGSFSNNATITFKIYATLPNQEIRLEIVAIPNDGSIGNPAPYIQTLTTDNDWVEMSFDLSANGFPNTADESVYTMLVVKPGNVDPGTTPADVTFYLDDFNITPN
ncbi:PKD domain-containing protein [Aquimarina litoralis]|uniref:PKD domain-containing protein n=1 Tax=Aquimarina litoralis TaxID=584605 RepID=UPI001C590518|nr:PKD domain-containing protein [Aquimarina litoralis]MBW1295378.1 PKD domain-containing protein [Aquimarina litoralis]